MSADVTTVSSARLMAACWTAGAIGRGKVGTLEIRVGQAARAERAAVEARVVLRGHGLEGAQPGDQSVRKRTLARELDGVGVERREDAAPRLEAPARVVVDLAGGELELDDPAGELLPARPPLAAWRPPRRASTAPPSRTWCASPSRSLPSSTGTASACPTTCSRSASTGPSNRATSSTRAPRSSATSSAESPARMWAWISRGLGRFAGASPSRSLRALRSSMRSTSSTASENLSPDSVARTSASSSVPMTLSCSMRTPLRSCV